MTFNMYYWVYWLTAIFGVYIIYKFMAIFFDKSQVNKRREIFTYFVYFIIINSIYLIYNVPIVILLTNLFLLTLLTFNYQSSMKKRILSTVFIYLILMAIESIVVLMLLYVFNFSFNMGNRYNSMVGMVVVKIVSYITVLLIERYKDIRKNVDVPIIYWLLIFVIPIGSLYIIIVLLEKYNSYTYIIPISVLILLAINIITIYLYGILNKLLDDKMRGVILKKQNKYYQKQLEIMEINNKSIRILNHDLRNHLAIIRGYIQIDESERALEYIDKMTQSDHIARKIFNSGNIDVDSVLNYKLTEASQRGISISSDVEVPANMNISSFDIVVLMGNLLDNAMEATSKIRNDRRIYIKLEYKGGELLLNIKNTFDGNVFYKKGKIITSKEDKKTME